jgi:hypothetical protein
VNAVINWGFDSLKLDGCGKQENIQLWCVRDSARLPAASRGLHP